MKKAILISACLLGLRCRYDGKNKPISPELISALNEKYSLIPVCPEIYGGLPTPRPSSERNGSEVRSSDGRDVTAEYLRGAEECLSLARICGADAAILKQKSPSCGTKLIYDGSFGRRLISGMGVTAELLLSEGFSLYDEDDILNLINLQE